MAGKKRRRTSKKSRFTLPMLVVGAVFLFLAGLLAGGELGIKVLPDTEQIRAAATAFIDTLFPDSSSPPVSQPTGGDIQVHAIDVGQGNSFLIQTSTSNVLIDAGENDKGETVLAFLKNHGVRKLDIAIGTHPHSDHIGGLDYILDHVPTDKVILPRIADDMVPTTKTYRDLLQVISDRGLKITAAKPGAQYNLGAGAILTILGPVGEDFKDLNDFSVVCRLDYGERSFLFCGDCSKAGENAILASGENVDVDVYFVPHHGSSTASQEKYLRAVTPMVSVISVGDRNSYGLPDGEVIKRLTPYGPIFRTDLQGSVTVLTDGKRIDVHTERGAQNTYSIKGA